jgi:hypothetical protein
MFFALPPVAATMIQANSKLLTAACHWNNEEITDDTNEETHQE